MFEWDKTGFFKGFVPNKTKKGSEKEPAVAYTKEENHITLEAARTHKSFSGVLADDAALIEFDDQEQGEIFLNIIKGLKIPCLVSDREGGQGHHFLFKDTLGQLKTCTGVMLACGVRKVDIKTGKRNGLECLKLLGNERTVIYNEVPYSETEKWMLPLDKVIEFSELADGDGRNPTLFRYIGSLQNAGLTIEEVRQTIRIINKFVLKEPVQEKEVESILRDDAFFRQSFFKGKTFLHDKFGDYLKNNNNIIKIDDKLHIYHEGTYIQALDKIEREMLKLIPFLTDAKRKEVLKYLNVICDEKVKADAKLITFKNGIYNIEDDSFMDFSPQHVITNKINWNYNPAAYSEIADKTLNKLACQDEQVRLLLEELIGYTFYRRNELGKAFILTGTGANGKSTFIAVLNHILGDKNIAALDLKELGDRFSTVTLYGKLANLGDDIGSNFIPDPSLFKKITTGDKITAEQKGQPKFEFNPYCKLIFSANNVPRMNDRSNAIIRRLVIIPFEAKFSDKDNDHDPEIKYKLQSQESIEYLISLGITSLKRVLKNKKFSISEKIKKEVDEFEVENNPVLGFLRECEEEDVQVENEPTKEIYQRYKGYCSRNGFQEMSKTSFSRQLNQVAGYTTAVTRLKGSLSRVYVKADNVTVT
ncbi:primase C-terminal domain-containing protein [Alkalicella caledoniensis]|uniref:Primase C-terminal domain-containing protein n=1 Tax=Alkalicella caledoniensis TaxID=2731377 RepID=A0A7G9W9F5_ALKCA|nr:phage/plasmid primase, P4 family [Alkalicella caledoniensis]QNO15317.1 primase C-terminal domain-containing protein [Alkalicella caledoniensis]